MENEKQAPKYKPTPTWFMQKSDLFDTRELPTDPKERLAAIKVAVNNEYLFAAEETAAASLMDPTKSSWQRQDIKVIGYSDCSELNKKLRDARYENDENEIFNKQLTEQKIAVKEKENYLLKDQQLDPEDIAIARTPFKKVRPIREVLTTAYLSAFAEEVEIAIVNKKNGQYKNPTIQNVFTPGVTGAEREKILGEIGKR